MKYLILILVFLSCAKPDSIEDAVKHQNDRLSEIQLKPIQLHYMTNVVNYDTAQLIRSTFEIKNLGGGTEVKAVFHAGYIRSATGDRYWIQAGYHQWGSISYFFMPFKNGLVGVPSVSLAPFPVLQTGTVGVFEMRIVNGDVIVSFNGLDLLKYEIQALYFYTNQISMEGRGSVNKSQTISTVRFYPAMENENGRVSSAASSGSGYGVQLNGFNDVSMGSQIKTKPGQILW